MGSKITGLRSDWQYLGTVTATTGGTPTLALPSGWTELNLVLYLKNQSTGMVDITDQKTISFDLLANVPSIRNFIMRGNSTNTVELSISTTQVTYASSSVNYFVRVYYR